MIAESGPKIAEWVPDRAEGHLSASIVVLTHNRVDALKKCLDRLDRLTEVQAEIIVVDNGWSVAPFAGLGVPA